MVEGLSKHILIVTFAKDQSVVFIQDNIRVESLWHSG